MSPLAIGTVVVILGIGIALDRLSLRFLRPARREISRTPQDLGLSAEETTIDGEVKLRVWMMGDLESPTSLVLLVHGWGANSSGPLQLAPSLVAEGHAVVALDVRGHGRSDAGEFVTLRHFRDDVRRTTEVLKRRFPQAQVVVVGHSMGGAAALLVSADGGPIDRLVTIAAPFDIYDATRIWLAKRKLPGSAVIAVFRILWRRRIGVPYDRIHPGGRASDVRIPFLVVQPDGDTQVPVREGQRLAQALGGEAQVIENAGHSDVLARPEVHAMIARFVRGQVPVDPTVPNV